MVIEEKKRKEREEEVIQEFCLCTEENKDPPSYLAGLSSCEKVRSRSSKGTFDTKDRNEKRVPSHNNLSRTTGRNLS